jgi:hypothetical protein
MKLWSSNGHCSDANTWTHTEVETLNERILCVRIITKLDVLMAVKYQTLCSSWLWYCLVLWADYILEEYAYSSQRLKWVGSEVVLVIWGSYKEGGHGIQGKGVSCSLLPLCISWPFLQLPCITKPVSEHTHLSLEDRGSMFLRNISIHPQKYKVPEPIRPVVTVTTVKKLRIYAMKCHFWENFKSKVIFFCAYCTWIDNRGNGYNGWLASDIN